jgi:hypothetical protein
LAQNAGCPASARVGDVIMAVRALSLDRKEELPRPDHARIEAERFKYHRPDSGRPDRAVYLAAGCGEEIFEQDHAFSYPALRVFTVIHLFCKVAFSSSA